MLQLLPSDPGSSAQMWPHQHLVQLWNVPAPVLNSLAGESQSGKSFLDRPIYYPDHPISCDATFRVLCTCGPKSLCWTTHPSAPPTVHCEGCVACVCALTHAVHLQARVSRLQHSRRSTVTRDLRWTPPMATATAQSWALTAWGRAKNRHPWHCVTGQPSWDKTRPLDTQPPSQRNP